MCLPLRNQIPAARPGGLDTLLRTRAGVSGMPCARCSDPATRPGGVDTLLRTRAGVFRYPETLLNTHLPEPLVGPRQDAAESLRRRLAFDHPVSLHGSASVMGETQEIEAPGSVAVVLASPFPVRRLEVQHPGLLRMQFQPISGETLRQHQAQNHPARKGHHVSSPCAETTVSRHRHRHRHSIITPRS